MEQTEFKAFRVEEKEGTFIKEIKSRFISDLPEGDLLIKVYYSSLNYKDALSASGNRGVTRKYPHTPGIDAVGTVVSAKTNKFKVQDKVIVTGYDLGMNRDGGFGQFIRIPESWAVKLPENLTMKEAMIIGTAGLTAGISLLKLTETIKPDDGEIVVSGATGGVGTLCISILKKLGFRISAITGKEKERDYLMSIGAGDIIMRKDFESIENKPLFKSVFSGAIDTVGGVILENIIKSINPMGVVICCGNVASSSLNLSLFPFILRGVSLIGVSSQNYPMKDRERTWVKLSEDWKPDNLSNICTEISLNDLNEKIDLILKGGLKGRTIINMEL